MHNEYFEGVLQLRSPSREVLGFVRNAIQTHGKVRIAKEKKAGDGIDIYLSDQRFLQQVGKQLASRFCGRLKVTARLFTKDKMTSKDVHRVSVLFRLAQFNRGDTIVINGRSARILSIKKRVSLQDVRTGEVFVVPFERVMMLHQKQSA